MKVLVEFERAYAGSPMDAVWIIDSPENRSWFSEQAGRLDANSAVFDEDVEPLAVLEHVFCHHPDWTEILVRGVTLTPEIEDAVQQEAVIASLGDQEFMLGRL